MEWFAYFVHCDIFRKLAKAKSAEQYMDIYWRWKLGIPDVWDDLA